MPLPVGAALLDYRNPRTLLRPLRGHDGLRVHVHVQQHSLRARGGLPPLGKDQGLATVLELPRREAPLLEHLLEEVGVFLDVGWHRGIAGQAQEIEVLGEDRLRKLCGRRGLGVDQQGKSAEHAGPGESLGKTRDPHGHEIAFRLTGLRRHDGARLQGKAGGIDLSLRWQVRVTSITRLASARIQGFRQAWLAAETACRVSGDSVCWAMSSCGTVSANL